MDLWDKIRKKDLLMRNILVVGWVVVEELKSGGIFSAMSLLCEILSLPCMPW